MAEFFKFTGDKGDYISLNLDRVDAIRYDRPDERLEIFVNGERFMVIAIEPQDAERFMRRLPETESPTTEI